MVFAYFKLMHTIFIICNDITDLLLKVDNENILKSQFCVNETLTFVCTIQVNGIQWRVGSFLTGSDGVVSVGSGGALNTITRGMFTLTAEGVGGAPNFRSTLQVTSSPELNNTMVACADNVNPNHNQTAMIIIYGNDCINTLFNK